jgi:hypothetical protein
MLCDQPNRGKFGVGPIGEAVAPHIEELIRPLSAKNPQDAIEIAKRSFLFLGVEALESIEGVLEDGEDE